MKTQFYIPTEYKSSQTLSQIDEGDEITSQRLLYNLSNHSIRATDIRIIRGIL